MKTLIAAVGLLAVGATTASAQYSPYAKERFPYEARHHEICQQKARRLHDYERRAASDGRIDHRERETIRALKRDLDATCGRYRYHG